MGRQTVGCARPLWVVTRGGKGLGMYGSSWDTCPARHGPRLPLRSPSIPVVSPPPGEDPEQVFPSAGKALSELQVTPLACSPCH